MKKSFLSRILCCLVALLGVACAADTSISSTSEPLLDGQLDTMQVTWSFDGPGVLRADIADRGQYILEYDEQGVVLLNPELSQQLALSLDGEPRIWARTNTGGWLAMQSVIADSGNASSQASLEQRGENPAWNDHGLTTAAPLFLRGLELIQTHQTVASESDTVAGHQQPYLAIVLQHLAPALADWVIDEGGAYAGRNCAAMSYQNCVDCCLTKPGILARGCLLECEM